MKNAGDDPTLEILVENLEGQGPTACTAPQPSRDSHVYHVLRNITLPFWVLSLGFLELVLTLDHLVILKTLVALFIYFPQRTL